MPRRMSTGSGVGARSMYVKPFTAPTRSWMRVAAVSISAARARTRDSPRRSSGARRRAHRRCTLAASVSSAPSVIAGLGERARAGLRWRRVGPANRRWHPRGRRGRGGAHRLDDRVTCPCSCSALGSQGSARDIGRGRRRWRRAAPRRGARRRGGGRRPPAAARLSREQLGAPHDGRRGVVQLVRQARPRAAERNELLVATIVVR